MARLDLKLPERKKILEAHCQEVPKRLHRGDRRVHKNIKAKGREC
jgi:hypothetical protein